MRNYSSWKVVCLNLSTVFIKNPQENEYKEKYLAVGKRSSPTGMRKWGEKCPKFSCLLSLFVATTNRTSTALPPSNFCYVGYE